MVECNRNEKWNPHLFLAVALGSQFRGWSKFCTETTKPLLYIVMVIVANIRPAISKWNYVTMSMRAAHWMTYTDLKLKLRVR